MNILVVDDHRPSADALCRLLRHAGYTAIGAGSVSEALAIGAGMPRFDLLISDLSLPDGDGLTLPKLLRQRCGGKPANAFALTGHDEWYCLDQAREAGYGAYFLKPLAVDVLLTAMARLSQRMVVPDPVAVGAS